MLFCSVPMIEMLSICNKIIATKGEKSIPLIGGMNFLIGPRIGQVKLFRTGVIGV